MIPSGSDSTLHGLNPYPVIRVTRCLRVFQPQPNACDDRKCFLDYLQIVFTYCGTLTLEKQLDPVTGPGQMQIGDVFINGGSPGHAMLLVDMAANTAGRVIYLLAQGYMPAQDIHLVKNFGDIGLSPWYSANYERSVYTPGWVFYAGQLRAWPAKK